jgi:protein-L-isoaspartate(D-aspartate) O-methyltransferase
MSKIVNDLINQGYLKTDKIIEAFSEISRIEFVPKEMELQAEANIALPIGYGQTISQPLTVAFMLELLNLQEGHKVLDLGSGSGWTTALLSYVVGKNGKIIAVEKIKELLEIGKQNTDKFGFVRNGVAEFYEAEKEIGFSKLAPYDRILVSAFVPEIPSELIDQLKTGGIMVIPVKKSIIFLEKKDNSQISQEEFPGFEFVPLIID